MATKPNMTNMALTYNMISGWYMATKPNVTIDNVLFAKLTDPTKTQTLEARCYKYGIHPRSGHALFSALLPEDFYCYKNDISICDGILVKGQLRKYDLIHIYDLLEKEYGQDRANKFIMDAGTICEWLLSIY